MRPIMHITLGTVILASAGMMACFAVTTRQTHADGEIPITTTTPSQSSTPSSVQTLPGFPKWPSTWKPNAEPADLVADWMQGIGDTRRTPQLQEDAFARMFYGGRGVKAHLNDFLPRARITAEAGAGFTRLQKLWDLTAGYEHAADFPQATSRFLVTSPKPDEKAIGGYGECLTNLPAPIPESMRKQLGTTSPQGISIHLYPDPKTQRLNVVIANTGGEGVWLRALDSHPIIRPEFWDDTTNTWKEWENGQPGYCGNSAHRVYLPAGEHWIVGGLAYTRTTATRERLVLESGQDAWQSSEYVMPVTPQVPATGDTPR